jgi:hypothetical protein
MLKPVQVSDPPVSYQNGTTMSPHLPCRRPQERIADAHSIPGWCGVREEPSGGGGATDDKINHFLEKIVISSI